MLLIKAMKAIFYLILLFAFCVSCEKRHKTLSSKDRGVLENFFELLIKDNDFAYTLFGTKPVSIAGYLGDNPALFETLILEKGWANWQKYKDLFPSKNFELMKIDLGLQNGLHFKQIVIINKQATSDIIKKNLKIFQDFLKKDLPAESIVKILVENPETFKNINHRSDLFGILLGYGNINALNFEKRADLSLHISKVINPPFQEDLEGLDKLGKFFVKCYGKSEHKPNNLLDLDLPNAKGQLCKVIESMQHFEFDKSDFLLDQIQSVVFMGDLNDEETKWLKQNYTETLNKIIQAYDGKSIFEVTINQWMSH